jgi:hypothetical protein
MLCRHPCRRLHGAFEMAQRIEIWLFWRIRRVFLCAYARGSNKATPAGSLNLRRGELAEVKPMESIVDNETAHNRGLWFSPDMRLLCGTQQRVGKEDRQVNRGWDRRHAAARKCLRGIRRLFALRIRLLAGDLASPAFGPHLILG